jgi:hypothetical protein
MRPIHLTDVLACRDILAHVLSFCSFAVSLALLQTCWAIRGANLIDGKLALALVHNCALPHVNIDAVRTVVLHNARWIIAAIRRGDVRSMNQLVGWSSDSPLLPGLRTLLWPLRDEDEEDESGGDAELVSSCAHRMRMVFFPEGNALCTKESWCSLYLLAPPMQLLWAMSIDGVEGTSRMYSHEFLEGESQWGSATMWPTAAVASRRIRCDLLESPYKMRLDEIPSDEGCATRWHVWNLRHKCAWARTSCATRAGACEMPHDALLSPRLFGGAVRLALFLYGRDCGTQRCALSLSLSAQTLAHTHTGPPQHACTAHTHHARARAHTHARTHSLTLYRYQSSAHTGSCALPLAHRYDSSPMGRIVDPWAGILGPSAGLLAHGAGTCRRTSAATSARPAATGSSCTCAAAPPPWPRRTLRTRSASAASSSAYAREHTRNTGHAHTRARTHATQGTHARIP